MEINLMVILRAAQALLSIIVLGLTAAVLSAGGGRGPDPIGFLVFCVVWTWLALAYLMGARIVAPKFYHPFGVLGMEFVTMIFWFAGWVSTAALFNGWLHNCVGGPCDAAKASAAMGALEWVAWTGTLALAFIEWNQSRKGITDDSVAGKETADSEHSVAHPTAHELPAPQLDADGNRMQHNLSPVSAMSRTETGPVRIPSPLEYGGREV